jgi:hypothetical protein
MAIVAIVGQCKKLSSSKSNAQQLNDVSNTQASNCLRRQSYLQIRHREKSRNVRTSQVDKDMQLCKSIEMKMMSPEVVGKHETVGDSGRTSSNKQDNCQIGKLCHGHLVAYEERPNAAAETKLLLGCSLIAGRESQCKERCRIRIGTIAARRSRSR